MNLTDRLEAAVDGVRAFFEAERAYLEARFFAQYADEIAEHGLPDGMELPDLAETTEGLRPWCTAEVMRAYEGGGLPGLERLTDPDVDPDDLCSAREPLMVQLLDDAEGALLAAVAGRLFSFAGRHVDTLWLARPAEDGLRIVSVCRRDPEGTPLVALPGMGWRAACGRSLSAHTLRRLARLLPPIAPAEREAFFAAIDPGFTAEQQATAEAEILTLAESEPRSGAFDRLWHRMLALPAAIQRPAWRAQVHRALDPWNDDALLRTGRDPHHPAWPFTRALRLDVGGAPLDDAALAELQALPALRMLCLIDATASDLARAARLTGLQRLELRGPRTQITSLAPLVDHPSLRALALHECPALDLRPGWIPRCIAWLEVDNLPHDDLTPFAGADHLGHLQVAMTGFGRRLTRVGPVTGLERLPSLDLSYSGLADLSGIEHMPGLMRLNLMSTALTSIDPLGALTGLGWLNLAGCDRLHEIPAVARLTGLRSLNLSGTTAVTDLAPISACTTLRWLAVSGTRLTTFDPIEALTALETLGLSQCPALETLDLVRPLRRLRRVLIAACEALRDISALDGLPALQHVFVERCPKVPTIARGDRWDAPG